MILSKILFLYLQKFLVKLFNLKLRCQWCNIVLGALCSFLELLGQYRSSVKTLAQRIHRIRIPSRPQNFHPQIHLGNQYRVLRDIIWLKASLASVGPLFNVSEIGHHIMCELNFVRKHANYFSNRLPCRASGHLSAPRLPRKQS